MKKNKKILRLLWPITYIKSITRISTEIELKKIFLSRKNWKRVLDVGSKNSPYKKFINFEEYFRMDVVSETKPDICCDLHEIKCNDSSFNTIIATEVLEHLYNPQKALKEIYRILKKNGMLVLSTRFIYKYHPDPNDYYRFTRDSLEYLLKDFSEIKVLPLGNRLHIFWQILVNDSLLKHFLNFLNPLIARINFKKTKFNSGFIVIAKK